MQKSWYEILYNFKCLVGYAGDPYEACILDTDGDGWPDDCTNYMCESDNCPFVPNSGQEDCDFDGVGNACDSSPGICIVSIDNLYILFIFLLRWLYNDGLFVIYHIYTIKPDFPNILLSILKIKFNLFYSFPMFNIINKSYRSWHKYLYI